MPRYCFSAFISKFPRNSNENIVCLRKTRFSIESGLKTRPLSVNLCEIYKVCKLSNETDFLFTKVFIFFKHKCYPLQNCSLGQLHTNGDIVPVLVAALEVLNWYVLQHVCYYPKKCFNLLNRIANEQDFFSRVIMDFLIRS